MDPYTGDPPMELQFPVDPAAPSPGAQHATIEQAMAAAADMGTRSILDILAVSSEPAAEPPGGLDEMSDLGMFGGMEQLCKTLPLSPDDLVARFGSAQPSRKAVEAAMDKPVRGMDLFAIVPRGSCRHVVIYDGGQPSEVFFLGYSFD